MSLRPDFRVYIADSTETWTDSIQDKAGPLYGVHFFDANQVVTIEGVPCFEIYFLGTVWTQSMVGDGIEEITAYDETAERERSHIATRLVDLKKCGPLEIDWDHWDIALSRNGFEVDKARREFIESFLGHCSPEDFENYPTQGTSDEQA